MIGIITFHQAVNYGAVLQAYGLQKKIEHLGGKCEIIDYRCPFIESEYKVIGKKDYWPVRPEVSYVRHLVACMASIGMKRKKNKRFAHFLNQYMKMSPVCDNHAQLEKLQERYDALITGSDQVWNPVLTDNDDAFFLGFVKDNNKKFSYAASFGNMGKDFQLNDHFIVLLKKFNDISVRENSGNKYLSETVKKESFVHVDPTLLLNRSEWEEMSEKPSESRYLLIYSVCEPFHLLEAAKEVAEKENLQIIYLKDKVFSGDNKINYVTASSPEQFVGYFEHADYVVTNSFHGTVFSVIFRKQFLVELESKLGRNHRVSDLLDLLGVEDREIVNGSVSSYKKPIDWELVERKIDEQRGCSEEYLNRIIQKKS